MGFLAMILNMGIIQLQDMKDYWSTHYTTNLPFFRSVFSRDRFFQIFGALYVGDPDSTTKKGKIQPLLNRLCTSFEAAHTPDKQIAVDESVICFKGRVSFRQYLKGKPNPWGIKAYVLSDSKSGYLQRVCVYYGRETELIDREDLGQTTKVVLTLVQPFHHKGYDLYVDRFYSSPTPATELSNVGISVTGTVQTNRKGVPTAVKKGHKEPVGKVRAFRSEDGKGDILVLTWMDKRKIVMLSTKHKVAMVQCRKGNIRHTTCTHMLSLPFTHTHTCTYIYIHVLALILTNNYTHKHR